MVTSSRDLQPSKAWLLISFKEEGRLRFLRLEQPLKAATFTSANEPSILTVSNEVQFWKTACPKLAILSRETAFRLLQSANAMAPTLVTDAIWMVSRSLQPSKAADSISSTELGSFMVVILSQLLKAEPPIFFVPSGILMLLRALHLLKAWGVISLIPSGSWMAVRLLQPSNASLPSVFRPAGRLMAVRLSQSWEASTSMMVTEAGIVTSTRLVQPLKQPLLMALMLLGRTTFFRFFAPEKKPFGSSLACVLIPPLSLLSTIVIPERSTVFTRHSSGFFLSVFVRVTIS